MIEDQQQEPGSTVPLGARRLEQRSGRGSVLILGLAKTGTTGLYNAIKQGLHAEGSNYYYLFEPTDPDQTKSLMRYAPETRILSKVMLSRFPKLRLDLSTFRRRILIARDPRDTLVSHVVFRAVLPHKNAEPDAHETFLDELRKKESDPASISVLGLHELANDLGLGWLRVNRHQEFWQQLTDLQTGGDFYSVTYEDFVDGNVGRLESYLDLELQPPQTPKWLQHIDRTRGYGEWRRWFTSEDVAVLRPLVDPFLTAFGYDSDWETNDEPIDPSGSSEYVEKQLRRSHVRDQGKFEVPVTEADSDRLHELAEDGKAAAMYTLAKVYRSGNDVLPLDAHQAFDWAYRAAIQGHRYAQYFIATMYQDGEGVDRDVDRSRFWLREAADRGVEPAKKALERRHGEGVR